MVWRYFMLVYVIGSNFTLFPKLFYVMSCCFGVPYLDYCFHYYYLLNLGLGVLIRSHLFLGDVFLIGE